MVANVASIKAIVKVLKNHQGMIIVDPVMGPSAGGTWVDENWLTTFNQEIPQVADLITPNLYEAQNLVGDEIANEDSCLVQLKTFGYKNIIITGGNGDSNQTTDYVVIGDQQKFTLFGDKITGNTRGTGCCFASSIAAAINLNYPLTDAIIIARMQIANHIQNELSTFPSMKYLPKVIGNNSENYNNPNKLVEDLGVCPIISQAAQLPSLIAIGIKYAQLRIKNSHRSDIISELKKASVYIKGSKLKLYVNDHWQTCLSFPKGTFAGIHLGQEDLKKADINAIFNHGLGLGISAHNFTEVAIATRYDPSYISFGPVFPTDSKKLNYKILGVEELSKLTNQLNYPAIAIGGIASNNINKIANVNLNGVACIKAAQSMSDLQELILAWQNIKGN